MITYLSVCLLTLGVVLVGCGEDQKDVGQPQPKPNKASGVIAIDTVWSSDNDPYIVEDNITVAREATLHIESGVEVRFDGFYRLTVHGALVASGTPQSVILFTSNSDAPRSKAWEGIRFQNTNDDQSRLEMVRIEYADIGIDCFSSSPEVTDCWIINNQIGIRTFDSSPVLTHNRIQANMTGVFVAQTTTTPDFLNNVVTQNQNGIVILYSFRVMRQNNLFDNADHAIVVDSPRDINVRENWWGTADPAEIAEQIFDKQDRADLGEAIYLPVLPNQVADAGPRI